MAENIVLYDGQCRLCSFIKNQIERKDHLSVMRFVPQESTAGKLYLQNLQLKSFEKNSLVYIENHNHFTKSLAVLRILRRIRKFSLLYYLILIFPKSLSNRVYDLIASLRNTSHLT